MFCLTFLLMQVPMAGKAYAACLVAVPGVLATLYGVAFSRVPLPPGARVARLAGARSDRLPAEPHPAG